MSTHLWSKLPNVAARNFGPVAGGSPFVPWPQEQPIAPPVSRCLIHSHMIHFQATTWPIWKRDSHGHQSSTDAPDNRRSTAAEAAVPIPYSLLLALHGRHGGGVPLHSPGELPANGGIFGTLKNADGSYGSLMIFGNGCQSPCLAVSVFFLAACDYFWQLSCLLFAVSRYDKLNAKRQGASEYSKMGRPLTASFATGAASKSFWHAAANAALKVGVRYKDESCMPHSEAGQVVNKMSTTIK